MKKVWNILLWIGIAALAMPVATGIYKVFMENWKFFDWLIMYSFIYWPTYLLGILLIVVSIMKRKK